jgi:hypothetical protein
MKLFRKITSVLLAVVFLLSSMSFTISSMVCLKSGKGKVSLSVLKDCCGKKELPSTGTYFTKGSCCKISNLFIKLHDFNPSVKISVGQPLVAHDFLNLFSLTPCILASSEATFHCADLPPPCHGRTLLSFISIYRI